MVAPTNRISLWRSCHARHFSFLSRLRTSSRKYFLFLNSNKCLFSSTSAGTKTKSSFSKFKTKTEKKKARKDFHKKTTSDEEKQRQADRQTDRSIDRWGGGGGGVEADQLLDAPAESRSSPGVSPPLNLLLLRIKLIKLMKVIKLDQICSSTSSLGSGSFHSPPSGSFVFCRLSLASLRRGFSFQPETHVSRILASFSFVPNRVFAVCRRFVLLVSTQMFMYSGFLRLFCDRFLLLFCVFGFHVSQSSHFSSSLRCSADF